MIGQNSSFLKIVQLLTFIFYRPNFLMGKVAVTFCTFLILLVTLVWYLLIEIPSLIGILLKGGYYYSDSTDVNTMFTQEKSQQL